MEIKLFFDLSEGTCKQFQSEFSDEFLAGKDISNPKGSYVYGHYTTDGKLFYVGKGIKERAWDLDRHVVWQFYFENHLKGIHKVRIIQDSLNNEEAEELEESIINKYGAELVNWINSGRLMNYAAYDEFHRLRNINRALIVSAKTLEKENPEEAIKMYRKAIASTLEYQSMDLEGGLVGQLMKEMWAKDGYSGEHEAINRLTMCLCKLDRSEEAFDDAKAYFDIFKRDQFLSVGKSVIARVEKKAKKSLGLNHE